MSEISGVVRPSIAVVLIRHAESYNNQVYREAHYKFRYGTPDFDAEKWDDYINEHRHADPSISDIGQQQAERLAGYLVPHLANQASRPVRVVVSPMKRALETIIPTLKGLAENSTEEQGTQQTDDDNTEKLNRQWCRVTVNSFYHESGGSFLRDTPDPGMNRHEIMNMLHPAISSQCSVSFEGFNGGEGWFARETSPEARPQSEARAAKFYLWLCDFLDRQLQKAKDDIDIFDAGVAIPGEETEKEHDKFSPRQRLRRTVLLVGHGDFMGLLLKRIMTCFGHAIEKEGVTHRSAFIHFNTGMTQLEYFGAGRFLLMGSNQIPHLSADDHELMTGGGLKDGWAYLVPPDELIPSEEVSVVLSDDLEIHIQEQTDALKSLYLPPPEKRLIRRKSSLKVDRMNENEGAGLLERSMSEILQNRELTFVAKRGREVLGCATLNNLTGQMSDVVIKPSARDSDIGNKLMDAVKVHARKVGMETISAERHSEEYGAFLNKLGFSNEQDDDCDNDG